MSMTVFLLITSAFACPTNAILRFKLQHWFPSGQERWAAAASKCQNELSAYFANDRTTACQPPCSCAADCILQDIPATSESNFASAQVILGLAPAVLLLVGPSIAEVAALSTRRPLLAVLVALGCPTSYIMRVFSSVDVMEPFADRERSCIADRWADYIASLHNSDIGDAGIDTCETAPKRGRRWTLGICETSMYVLALAAIANGVQISIYTDMRTISGWRYGALFMPLVWFSMSVVEHGRGFIAPRLQIWSTRPRGKIESERARAESYDPHPVTSHVTPPLGSAVFKGAKWLRLHSLIESKSYALLRYDPKPTIWSELVFWIAQASALVHMIFGIFELSSLVFISALESVEVFARLAFSVVLCQIVVQAELGVMRKELQQDRTKVRSPEVLAGDSAPGTAAAIPLEDIGHADSDRTGHSHRSGNRSDGSLGSGYALTVHPGAGTSVGSMGSTRTP